MAFQIRPFDETRDYPALADLAATVDPDAGGTAASLRRRDAQREARVRLHRLVAEDVGEQMVGFGRIMTIWWAYHPRHFQMRIEVLPARRRQGMGSALFERLLAQLQAWDAELVRAEALASAPESMAFLEHRGFGEWRRRWQSELDVATAETASLVEADRRMAAEGITITTYAEELERRGDGLLRETYAADVRFSSDEPAFHADEESEPMSLERYAAFNFGPDALDDGHFLALREGQIVGLSRLRRMPRRPDVLDQDFTGVDPAMRGRGIAKALKLRTIEYARAHGYRAIRTSNDTANAAMIHINDGIGFKRESPTVVFERRLAAADP